MVIVNEIIGKMGLNRIVNLFNGKLNNVSVSSRNGSDSGSERNDDCSTSMSWPSSSVESLSTDIAMMTATTSTMLANPVAQEAFREGLTAKDVNENNSQQHTPHVWNAKKSLQFVSNGAKVVAVRELNSSNDDGMVVLGGAEDRGLLNVTHSTQPIKRSSVFSRRFSLKAKFSSDMDLYGTSISHRRISVEDVGGPATTTTTAQSSASLGRLQVKKSIWASFRLPVRLLKGNGHKCGRRSIWFNAM